MDNVNIAFKLFSHIHKNALQAVEKQATIETCRIQIENVKAAKNLFTLTTRRCLSGSTARMAIGLQLLVCS